MSWLSVPSVENIEITPSLSLANAREILKVLGELKDKLSGFKKKSAVEILDFLIQNPDKYDASVELELNQITELKKRK